MLAFTAAALTSALAASALQPHLVTRSVLSVRQSAGGLDVPDACTSTCSSALSIYNACSTGDTSTCLSVCQQDTFTGFLGCIDCLVENTPGFSSAEGQQLSGAVGQIQQACAAASETVTGSLTATAATVSDSASASGSATSGTSAASASASGAIQSLSSVASAASTGAAASASSVASQASSAASAASSAASAAASPSSAAALGMKPAQVLAGAAGLVGAAMLF